MPNAIPLVLDLPAGRATLVAGSLETGQPLYEYADGTCVAADPRIPPDLATCWFWPGYSALRLITAPGDCGVSIATKTYPPPGVDPDRRTCFDMAREYEAMGLL